MHYGYALRNYENKGDDKTKGKSICTRFWGCVFVFLFVVCCYLKKAVCNGETKT
jgi:hypothetical protein